MAPFEPVFYHADATQVREIEMGIWEEVREACTGGFREVTVTELLEVSRAWKPGKTSGPNGVTYEALRAILEHEPWGAWLAGMFSRVLHAGVLPREWARSLTVLLPKTAQPGGWRETRPIMLLSVVLKPWPSCSNIDLAGGYGSPRGSNTPSGGSRQPR